MKNIFKYILTFILSILAIFYSKGELNIIFAIPLLAFFMFNGIRVFIISLSGIAIGSLINYLLFKNILQSTYLLIGISIYFLLYFISLLINKKLIINYVTSTLLSIIITYLIYFISNNIFDTYTFIQIIILSVILCFLFAFLIKSFSFHLVSKIDIYSPLLIYSLIIIYTSLISKISESPYIFYLSLFLCVFLDLIFAIKNEIINTLSLNSVIIVLALAFDIHIIYENIYLFLPISVCLCLNKSKLTYLNTLLSFTLFFCIYIIKQYPFPIIYFIYALIASFSLLFINKGDKKENNNKYYIQYVKNKNEMLYQFNNFKNMFNTLGISFLNSRTNKILNKLNEDVFNLFCKDCNECFNCNIKGRHILLNYLKDYLDNNINEDKIRYVKANCNKQQTYFTLLDTFCKTTLINNYKNELNIKSKQIIANDFLSFSNVMNQVSKAIENDRLMIANNFYKNIKNTLNEYTFDILFINDHSTKDTYYFDLAIKDIKKGEIEEVLIPLINQTLQTKMKVDKIDTATLSSSYYIVSISELPFLKVNYAIKQSNEDIKANGDNYFSHIENNIFYLSISDGMGCGINANEESKFILNSLLSMLKAKIDIKDSIKLSNNILQLKNESESYATLDLLAIDLQSSIVSFFKLGAFSSFIIRDHIVTEINNYSLPLGIVDEVKIYPSSYKIAKNDIIVMCSDGMIDDTNLNIISILEDLSIDNCETICNLLFSKLIKVRENSDDATLAIITIN